MEFTRQNPSLTPLSATILVTSDVMLMNARRAGVLNVRYAVLDFMPMAAGLVEVKKKKKKMLLCRVLTGCCYYYCY
jgi:hypothetical protein